MKSNLLKVLQIALIIFVLFALVPPAGAKKSGGEYQTGFVRWRAAEGGFAGWTLTNGAFIDTSGTLNLNYADAKVETDPYAPESYYGINYYNGGTYKVGEATSPVITADFNYQEAIASWNAITPPGTWIEVQFTTRYGARWSKWYTLGIWASDDSTIKRHSVRLQGDSDGFVAVDTFISSNKKEVTDAFQIKLLLFSADGVATPTVKNASVAYSTTPPKSASMSAGDPINWGTLLAVPECSQMVYPDGGEVWCSPTSTSMVLGYWGYMSGPCEPRVKATVAGVYDWIYDGHGNWPFNTAYAAAQGYEAYVARFTSLAKAEEFVKAGVPVIMSIAWSKGDLTNAYISSTNGHLLVLVGFDSSGNPIINDPAWPTDDDVQHMYLRSEFEHLWLEASGGTVYLIYPEGHPVPSIP